MERKRFIQLSSEYALGALDADERRDFETYLVSASEEERSILAELTATASLLPMALEQQKPSPEVKERLLQKVSVSARAESAVRQRTGTVQGETAGRNWIPWGFAAAFAMIVVFSLFVLKLMGTIEQQHERLVSLQDELTRKEEQLKVLAAREVHISIMSGLQVNPVGYGKIIWDPEKGVAILHVSNLPAVAADRDYQLWVIKDNKPISAGVFAVKDTASNFFKIENLAVTNPKEIAAFAVTLEPKGGVPQPTGDMYMMGSPSL